MAIGDYACCDYCGNVKLFYDSEVDWENYGNRIGMIRIMCTECFKKNTPIDKKIDMVYNWGIHCHTVEGDPCPKK